MQIRTILLNLIKSVSNEIFFLIQQTFSKTNVVIIVVLIKKRIYFNFVC